MSTSGPHSDSGGSNNPSSSLPGSDGLAADPDRYDLFISYARQDDANGYISAFIEALKQEHRTFTGGRELVVFFDTQDIHSFDDWQRSLRDGISHGRLFLAFISPAYFASEWCRREWRLWVDQEIAKHILSEGAAPIYFVEVPGFFDKPPLSEQQVAEKIAALCPPPSLDDEHRRDAAVVVGQIRGRQQITTQFCKPFAEEGVRALQRADLQKILANLARDLRQRADDVRRAAFSVTTVPAYNKYFTGRLDELLTLRDRLQDNRAGVICGVCGLGGIGKTELAFTYAHAFAGVYPGGRFYIPCEFRATLQEALIGAAASFPVVVPEEQRRTPEDHAHFLQEWLRRRLADKGSILLVLDNVSDAALVSPEQTRSLTALGPALHLLATTRLLPPSAAGWLTLGEMSEDEALRLMEKLRPFADDAEKAAARTIVKRLGGFALAVELTAAWLGAHPNVPCAALARDIGLQDLEDYAQDGNVKLQQHNHERRLTAVLGPVLGDLSDEQLRIMEYAAFLPPDHVPLPWLRVLIARDFPDLKPATRHADAFEDLITSLERLALLTRPPKAAEKRPRLMRVHRMVRQVLLARLNEKDKAARGRAVVDLVKERDVALKATTQWLDARWELEPFAALAGQWDEEGHPDSAWLANQVANCLQHLAEWTRAEPLMRRVLTIAEISFDKEHPNLATVLNNLATLLQATNRLAEAEPLMRRALAIDEASFGKEHPNVARDLNGLSSLLQTTNRLAEAEPLMRRALAINEASFGKEHPEVATVLNNLAALLQATNRLPEAEPLMRRALTIEEAFFGKEHPNVARVLNNLAQLLKVTNRMGEAEPLMRRGLAIEENSKGKDHPHVAIQLNNLAQLLKATNRLAEAEPLMRRALAIDEASFGKVHPNVAIRLNNLAQLLQDTNRLAEAEPLMRRALAINEASFGKEHPTFAISLAVLAHLLKATNRLAEAEPLMRRVVDIFAASLGENHPNVATALSHLAQLLKATNRLAEAEPLMRRALAIDEASFGKKHPNVASALNNLATLLQATNRLPEAEPLIRRALAINEASFGKEHPNVASALNNLATLLQATNRLPEAEPLMRRALAINEASFGKEHPEVAIGLNNLASLFMATNRLPEAEPLVRRHVVIFLNFTAATGHPHPHMFGALRNYAILCQEMELPQEEVNARLVAMCGEAGLDQAAAMQILKQAFGQ